MSRVVPLRDHEFIPYETVEKETDPTGCFKAIDRSKYTPHQGKRECERRMKKYGSE